MPHWSLRFEGPIPWDELARAASAVVDALTGAAGEWATDQRTEVDDPNGNLGNTFRRVLERVDARCLLTQQAGEGNPRDGYGYHRRFELALPAQNVKLWADDSGYDACFSRMYLYADSARPADVDAIRGAMRGVLGAERDRSAAAGLAARNIGAALALDEPRARAWLAEAKALGPQESGWKELLTWVARLEGSSPALLAQRLREAPHDPAAWDEATPETSGLTADVLAEVRRRFTAPAPTSGWRRLEDGLGPIPGRMGLSGHLETALWGQALPYESGLLPGATAETRRRLRATWSAGAHPRMAIEEAVTRDGETTSTLQLWDMTAGDGLALRWVVLGEPGRGLHLGFAAAAEGSAAFQERAWAALAWLTPSRWEPTPLAELFTERAQRDGTRVRRSLPRKGQVEVMLSLLDEPALPELRDILLKCRCGEPFCAHVLRVIGLQRAHATAALHATLWDEYCTGLARAAALDAVIALLQKKTDGVGYALTRAEQHLATRGSLRPGVAIRDVRS